jgi:hypothetical protein
MDGVRRAFHDRVNWQCRPGAPELGCCPVNGPRGLSMLSEWAVMLDDDGPLINYYGPGKTTLTMRDGIPLTLRQETSYPVEGTVALIVEPEERAEFNLRLRIPLWSKETQVTVNGEPIDGVRPGEYLSLRRRWSRDDKVELKLDMGLRTEPGEGIRKGRVNLFRGPLLLAYDQHYNLDRVSPPTLNPVDLAAQRRPVPDETLPSWLLVEVGPAKDRVTLCDFASAGAYGTPYRSWLPATGTGPAPFYLAKPVNDQHVAPGKLLLEWGALGSLSRPVPYEQTLLLSRHPDGSDPMFEVEAEFAYYVVDLEPGRYYWQVIRRNEHGERTNKFGFQSFVVDPDVESRPLDLPPKLQMSPDGVVASSKLDGNGAPTFGQLLVSRNVAPAEDRHGDKSGAVAFNGQDSKISYKLAYFPSDNYSATCWFYLESYPKALYEQIVSAWCPGEDPLRITVEGKELHARIAGFDTGGTRRVKVDLERWIHVAAVKEGGQLTFYVDGKLIGSTAAPASVFSRSTEIAIGANPLYSGHEYLHGRIDDFSFYARALTADEVRQAFEGR